MKVPQKISLKTVIITVLLSVLFTTTIVYVLASPNGTFTISPYIYPGSVTYTVFKEGATIYAKNAYGEIEFSGINASQVINNVINSIDKGTVLITKGNYTITAPIIPKSRVRLIGEGIGKTVLYGSGQNFSIIQAFGSKTSPIFDIEISHMTLDGSGLTETGITGAIYKSKGIYIQYLKRAFFSNLYIYNTPATGLGVDFLVDSVIQKVITEKTGRQWETGLIGGNGIGIGTGAWEHETLVISDCHAIDAGNNGIMFESQAITGFVMSGYMRVIGCTARKNRIGFRDSGSMRITFDGCAAMDNDQDGFAFSKKGDTGLAAKEHIISNSHIFNNGRHGIHISYAEEPFNLVVDSCLITGNSEHGIYSPSTVTEVNIKISGSYIYENDKTGIFLSKPRNVEISNNFIYNNGLGGITGENDGIKIDDAGDATWVHKNIRIYNNLIYDNQASPTQRYGIAISGGSSYLVIESNSFFNNTAGALILTETPQSARIKFNIGYATENSGTAIISASTTVTFDHELDGTPDLVYVSFNSTAYGSWTWTATSTQITITVATSGNYEVYWSADFIPP